MGNENNHCYLCRNYKPYYTKGYTQFDRCDIGLCTKKKATVENHGVCKKYTCAHYSRIDRRQAALDALAVHINILAEIKQILQEDDEEAVEELFYNFKNRKSRCAPAAFTPRARCCFKIDKDV